MIAYLKSMRWTIAFAVIFGYFMSPVAYQGAFKLLAEYDSWNPIVEMRGTLLEHTDDYAIISIRGKKLRNCQFLQLDSYYQTPTGLLVDANEIKVDGVPFDGSTRPIGNYDLGLWKVFPLKEATSVQMYTEHSCSGRVILTKIADVKL